ncbi:hypothetical protein FXO37_13749 [Capsicum annuum]|nr:hypothetical protein FXO37_13749 [Capsicum annuum]
MGGVGRRRRSKEDWWKCIPACIWWSLWMERNERSHDGQASSIQKIKTKSLRTDELLSEARWLLDLGLLPNSNPATRSIGYRQAMEYLLRCRENGGWSSAGDFYGFLSEFQTASRHFARRQMSWFRNEQIYEWINASKPLGNEFPPFFLTTTIHNKVEVVKPDKLGLRYFKRSHSEGSSSDTSTLTLSPVSL